jgi:hypothetical protein
MLTRKSFIYVLYIFFLTCACFLLAMEGTEAATYNFYFNNTEQGANSTASPTLNVDGNQLPNTQLNSPTQESEPTPPALLNPTSTLLQSEEKLAQSEIATRKKLMFLFGATYYQKEKEDEISVYRPMDRSMFFGLEHIVSTELSVSAKVTYQQGEAPIYREILVDKANGGRFENSNVFGVPKKQLQTPPWGGEVMSKFVLLGQNSNKSSLSALVGASYKAIAEYIDYGSGFRSNEKDYAIHGLKNGKFTYRLLPLIGIQGRLGLGKLASVEASAIRNLLIKQNEFNMGIAVSI